MKSFLYKIYYDGGLFEQFALTAEYRRLMDEHYELTERFREGLTQEQKNIFDKMWDLSCGMEGEAGFQNYGQGFRDGMALTLEMCGIPLKE